MNIRAEKLKGFGLIEVLIASTIMIIVVFSLATTAQGTLTATNRTHDRTQAANLAAEGIEIVRNIRDTDWIDQDPTTDWGKWDNNNAGLTGSWVSVVPGSSYVVGFGNGRFFLSGPTSGTESIILNSSVFSRTIKIETVGSLLSGVSSDANLSTNSYSYKVTSIVKTPSGAELKLSEILTNWRPNY